MEQAGNGQVFRGSLGSVAEALMDHGQVRAGGHMVGVQLGHADPVFKGFFRILVFDVSSAAFIKARIASGIIPRRSESWPTFSRGTGSVGAASAAF